jgi:Fur family ferric uptake transcriptional regulator
MDKDTIKSLGMKVTGPRIKILKLLERSPNRHMSAEEIYQQLKNEEIEVGFATVYRVLTQFESAGLVVRHNFEGDHSVFELDNGKHHDHLVCLDCGKVHEFLDEEIESRQNNIAKEAGYLITDHALTIYGLCGECQK